MVSETNKSFFFDDVSTSRRGKIKTIIPKNLYTFFLQIFTIMPSHYKKRRKKNSKSAYNMAKKALKSVSRISRGIEAKHFDVTAGINNVDDAGNFSADLFIPPQGFSDLARIGDKVQCTSLLLRGRVEIGTDLLNTQFRMIVFWDKRNTISTTADILPLIGTNQLPISHYNHDLRGDWIKLWDKTWELTEVDRSVQIFQRRIRVNKTTVFNQGSTVVNQGRIGILYVSDISNGQVATAKPNIFLQTRAFFLDM